MKYCRNCGNEVPDEAAICMKCGCRVEAQENVYKYKSDTNGMAIAGFICSFFIPLLGWIFGGIGLSKANKLYGKGKGFAIAAIIISTVSFIVGIIIYSNAATSAASYSYYW